MEHDRRVVEIQTPSILRKLVFIIFDRFMLIMLIFLTVFLIFLLYAVLTPNKYKASSIINISIPQTLDPLQQEITWDYQERARRILQSQRELIFSNRVMEHVVNQYYPETSPENYTKVLNMIRKRVEVTPPEGQTFSESSTFYLTYSDLNPERTAKIASFITNVYLMEYEKLSKEKTDYSYKFFLDQTQELYNDMITKAKALREYETLQALSLVEILALDPDRVTTAEIGPNALLNHFQSKYYGLTEDLSALNASINSLENEMKQHQIPALPENMEVFGKAVVTYRNKVAQLEILMNGLKSQFTVEFIPLEHAKKEFEMSVNSLREEVSRTIRSQRMATDQISSRIQEVEKVIAELQERIRETAYERSKYERLKQDYNIARATFLSAKDKSEQARLASVVSQSHQLLSLLESPMPPSRPASPNRPLIIALGFLSALLLGLGFAVTADFFDHSLKKPQDIDTHFKVPSLGSLPNVR